MWPLRTAVERLFLLARLGVGSTSPYRSMLASARYEPAAEQVNPPENHRWRLSLVELGEMRSWKIGSIFGYGSTSVTRRLTVKNLKYMYRWSRDGRAARDLQPMGSWPRPQVDDFRLLRCMQSPWPGLPPPRCRLRRCSQYATTAPVVGDCKNVLDLLMYSCRYPSPHSGYPIPIC